MTTEKFVRWWPPVGLVTMAVLGWVVGKASTPVDDVFQQAGRDTRPYSGWLLFFTDPRTLLAMLVIAVGMTVRATDAGSASLAASIRKVLLAVVEDGAPVNASPLFPADEGEKARLLDGGRKLVATIEASPETPVLESRLSRGTW